MAILAQTYLHLKVRASDKQLAEAQAYLEYIAALSALKQFDRDTELGFRIEDGSLKGWLTVIGGLYAGICSYGSFREGIDYAVKDARAFSEFVIERVTNEVHMPQGALYRSEHRLGLPGRIQRLYPLLDETSELIGMQYNTRVHQRLDHVQNQIQQIAGELDEPGGKKILRALRASIPAPIRERLPEPVPKIPLHETHVKGVTDDKRISGLKPREILQRHPTPPKPPRFR